MTAKLRALILACLATLPLQAAGQDVPPPAMMNPLRDLGLIPDGEERMFQLSGKIDILTATQEQVNAAVDVTLFSISPTSGFCISALAPGDPTVLLFNGADRVSMVSLFDADSGADGLSTAEGRRTFVRTTGPVNEMSFILSTVVGQTPTAAGDTATIFVRVYPETMAAADLDAICGPFKMFPMATPMPPPPMPMPMPPAPMPMPGPLPPGL
jgi:hypothetical protein